MKNETLFKMAAIVILAPIVIGVVVKGGTAIVNGASKAIARAKLKKAIKEGSIVEIDGLYYEVKQTAEEA